MSLTQVWCSRLSSCGLSDSKQFAEKLKKLPQGCHNMLRTSGTFQGHCCNQLWQDQTRATAVLYMILEVRSSQRLQHPPDLLTSLRILRSDLPRLGKLSLLPACLTLTGSGSTSRKWLGALFVAPASLAIVVYSPCRSSAFFSLPGHRPLRSSPCRDAWHDLGLFSKQWLRPK